MNITAAQVNELRKRTGAGMMDCKNALKENEGDMEKAIDYLRKKGQKMAAKRADRVASEGVVIAKTSSDNQYGAVVMVNCETDFVAKNDDFVKYVHEIADLTVQHKVKDIEALKNLELNGRKVSDTIMDQTGVIGEKIELGAMKVLEAPVVASYIHAGNRLATLVGLNKAIENVDQIGREIAMHIAAMDPVAIDEKDVSKEVIEREIEIGMDQARNEGKPEDMLEKIARGKLSKFYRENTLLNQGFARDPKKPVGTYLKEADKDLTVTGFQRLMLG